MVVEEKKSIQEEARVKLPVQVAELPRSVPVPSHLLKLCREKKIAAPACAQLGVNTHRISGPEESPSGGALARPYAGTERWGYGLISHEVLEELVQKKDSLKSLYEVMTSKLDSQPEQEWRVSGSQEKSVYYVLDKERELQELSKKALDGEARVLLWMLKTSCSCGGAKWTLGVTIGQTVVGLVSEKIKEYPKDQKGFYKLE